MYRPAAQIAKAFNRRRVRTPPSLKRHLKAIIVRDNRVVASA
jgi:hypothetical protein